ncbi:LysR substrate-binding domain-containing protein, partial [Burkholderia ambifaria]|uniref:LysR substrate-binding domain-containing protein n=1 Tax=Burkholderia ambifaria TaxID=152480 RepID=UPI001FC89DE4
LIGFLREHPRVSVEWLLQDEVHDFIGTGIDCAIQIGEVTDPSVVAIRIADVARFVVAAPSMFEDGRIPATAEELEAGRLVRVAPDWEAAPLPVFLVYPHAQFYPSRLLRFVAIMRDAVPKLVGDTLRFG